MLPAAHFWSPNFILIAKLTAEIKLSSQVVIAASFVLSLPAFHKYNKSWPVCSGKNVIYFTSEKHFGNNTQGNLFCTRTRLRAVNIKLKLGTCSYHPHTVTTTQFK
jgi:hypothetical protein